MSFADEIKDYTDDELDLIIATQKDLYSAEEMEQLESLWAERKRIKQEEYEAKVLSRLPETINCEKCDGPNSFSNEVCVYCGHKIDKAKYYTDEYYERIEENEEIEEIEFPNSQRNSYAFHYIISFLIPLIGFIVGAVMLANDNAEKRSCGKTCIIVGFVSMIVSAVVVGLFWI